LADAYLALDDSERLAVIEPLRRLRSTLAQARADEPGSEEQILDVPCHVTRVATTELCLWEATGLPLRYDSAGLRLRALNIDTDVDIGARAFEVPFEPAPVPGFDAAGALRRLARGDLGELVPLLHPGLRLPTA
jgi:hypothetical protein